MAARELAVGRLDEKLVEKQKILSARSNWLHDRMFDFRCNFKIMATAEGDVISEFSTALTSSLYDLVHPFHKLLKGEQTACI